ncbi:predicted protein [Nematostella vectensis]|uniref:Uncharacterized protein n=1 Tax=Nematostella vectensis TaxID=45351 RepID=A7SUK4_NEMVE|nr:predicted protein [Nematostella vectensis]|eukprot:XP_001624722.1 predicted protein [Nematostella vectensis]
MMRLLLLVTYDRAPTPSTPVNQRHTPALLNFFFFFLNAVKGLMGSSSYGIVMPKQSPYLLNISRSILKLQENGKLEDLRRKWWVERTKCPEYRKLTSDEIIENMRIQIGSMVGVYVVLAMGGIAGVVVLLIELEWKKRRDRLKAKVQQGWKTMRATKTVMALQKKSKDDGDGEDVKKKAAIQAFGMPLNTPSKKWGAKNSDTPDGGRQSRQRKGSEKAIIMDMETSA